METKRMRNAENHPNDVRRPLSGWRHGALSLALILSFASQALALSGLDPAKGTLRETEGTGRRPASLTLSDESALDLNNFALLALRSFSIGIVPQFRLSQKPDAAQMKEVIESMRVKFAAAIEAESASRSPFAKVRPEAIAATLAAFGVLVAIGLGIRERRKWLAAMAGPADPPAPAEPARAESSETEFGQPNSLTAYLFSAFGLRR